MNAVAATALNHGLDCMVPNAMPPNAAAQPSAP